MCDPMLCRLRNNYESNDEKENPKTKREGTSWNLFISSGKIKDTK
jgi:hypothetical protein